MIIWSNNFAEKLFGFAFSREQLRNYPALCEMLEDPNLQLDIDLAIDFNNAIRGDEVAAERFTNKLVLSSSYLDQSSLDFYTNRMVTYPMFDYHVARIDYIFNNINFISNNMTQYSNAYNTSSTGNSDEDGFLDKLLDALKDCLNSPCNLFAESSESIAAIADEGAAGNTSTIPSFAELKGKFKNVYGGMKTTLTKRLPDAVGGMFSELAVMGKEAWSQSVDMLYEKDPEKRQKIIDNALGGNALDSDSTSYSYIPDLDALTSVSSMASTILSQVASDLGGCHSKYQQLARYSPYDPEQNTSTTNKDPVVENVDGVPTVRTSSGGTPWDYKDRNLNVCKPSSNAKVSAPRSSSGGSGSSSSSSGGTSDPLKYSDQYAKVMEYLKGSKFDPAANGGKYIIPKDGSTYGINNGTLEEWADFFTRMADVESSYDPTTKDRDVSFGTYQLGKTAWNIHGGGGDIFNNDDNTKTFIRYAENLYFGGAGTDFDSYGGNERIGVYDPVKYPTYGYGGIAAGFGPLQDITYDEANGTGKASARENRILRK
jgi:hypothetical protein